MPTRTPKPILQNVRIADGTITATDLDLTITTPIDWSGQPMLLPFARLSAIVSTITAKEVTIEPDGQACTISAGGGTWRLPVEDVNEFPATTPAVGASIGRLPCDQFRALVSTVRFATDNETSRFALGGVLIEFNDGELTFVASDGRRMCIATAELDMALDQSETLVPRRVIDTLYRLASNDHQAIQLDASAKRLVATIGDTVVEAVLLDGQFPKWRKVEPDRPHVRPSLVVVGNLLHACRQAAICQSEASRGTLWSFTADGLWITARSAEYGESSATCDLVEVGTTCQVKLDPRFAVEWLEELDPAETVEVEAENENTAVVFRAQHCRNVVMPLAKD